MHILNFLLIPLILISFYCKIEFAYIISLLCSLAAATFIHTQVSLANILFTIAIFSLVPLVCRRFNASLHEYRLFLKGKETAAKFAHEQMLKEQSLLRRSNLQLNEEAPQIIELYKMTRNMSAVLEFGKIFAILGRKLRETFHFQKCRMILTDEEAESLRVKEAFELKYAQAYPQGVNTQIDDVEILKQSLGLHQPGFIAEKSVCVAPLIADNKFLGALTVEGLAANLLDNFSILVNQFSLQFERIRLYQKIQKMATTDGLTDLFVRRYFLKRLQEEIERSTRHNLKLGFLMVDVDHFKQYNDKFGHLTGDVVLREVAAMIKANVREIDLVARFGGEEFSVLLPDTDKDGTANVAERIRAGIDRHRFQAYNETIKIEVSIGVASFPEDALQTQDLIDKSDQALYRAKQEGRNRVCLFKGVITKSRC